MKVLMMVAAVALTLAAGAQGVLRSGGAQGSSFETILNRASTPKMAEQIGVTAEQMAKLKALNKAKREATKGLPEKVRQGGRRQAELIAAEKIDEQALRAAFDEVWAAKKEIALQQMKFLVGVRAILTAEQVKKAQEVIQGMRGKTTLKGGRAKPASK